MGRRIEWQVRLEHVGSGIRWIGMCGVRQSRIGVCAEGVMMIKTEAELQRTQDSVAWTDAAVVCIILQNKKGYDVNMMKVLTIIKDLNSSNRGQQLILNKVKQLKEYLPLSNC